MLILCIRPALALDNTVPSADNTVATDEIGGVHYQKFKLCDGTADSTACVPADAANGLDVDVTRLPALPAGTSNIGDVDVLTLPALPAGANNIGDVDVATLPALPAGTNNIGDMDVLTLPALPAGSNTIGNVGAVALAAGGCTPTKTISASSTNATSVKASAGQLYSVVAMNSNAAARFLKLYNKASAPTVGTDAPVQTFLLPGSSTGAGFALALPAGMAFANGIAFALTTGVADSDTGAVAANEIVVNLCYK